MAALVRSLSFSKREKKAEGGAPGPTAAGDTAAAQERPGAIVRSLSFGKRKERKASGEKAAGGAAAPREGDAAPKPITRSLSFSRPSITVKVFVCGLEAHGYDPAQPAFVTTVKGLARSWSLRDAVLKPLLTAVEEKTHDPATRITGVQVGSSARAITASVKEFAADAKAEDGLVTMWVTMVSASEAAQESAESAAAARTAELLGRAKMAGYRAAAARGVEETAESQARELHAVVQRSQSPIKLISKLGQLETGVLRGCSPGVGRGSKECSPAFAVAGQECSPRPSRTSDDEHSRRTTRLASAGNALAR